MTTANSNNTESGISKEVKSIGRKSGVYLIGQVLSKAIGFVMIPVYTHYITPTNYGVMEMIEVIASCLALMVAINVGESMARFYYAEKDQSERDKVVSTAFIGLALYGIPIALIAVFSTPFLGEVISDDPKYHFILQIAFITTWFAVLSEVGFSYLRMIYKAKLFVTVVIFQLFLALFLNIYFIVFLGLDILGIFYSTLISQGLAGIILAIGILKKTHLHFSFRLFQEIVAYGLPIVPSRVALILGFASNRFFLRWSNTSDPAIALAQVGLLSLGHKFGVVINRFVTSPFNAYWDPRRMELLLNEEPEAARTVARVCTYATMGTIFAALFVSAGIESVIDIIASPEYHDAYIVVPFIALAYIALGIETHFVAGLHYSKKTKPLTYIGIVGLAVVLLWNYIFIPKYGLLGAATSNLAGFVVRIVIIYIVSQRLFFIPYELSRIAVLFLIAFLLFYISQLVSFDSPYLTFFARSGIVALYPLVLFILRFYTLGEVKFMQHVLRRSLSAVK